MKNKKMTIWENIKDGKWERDLHPVLQWLVAIAIATGLCLLYYKFIGNIW